LDPNDNRHDNGVKNDGQAAANDPQAGQQPSEPVTLRDWFRVNGSSLLFGLIAIAALIVLNEVRFQISYLVVLMVGLGLSFIIFIHELGHFLVAKWCDVHVTTFSIGFGPALPGCSFTWGETTYKLAVFPLGGYVQMVGQVDGDESSDGSEDDPRSYKNKSVWQRMAIISAGVTMNAIFACVAFTALFLGPGTPRLAAVVAAVDSGKPAFKEGIRTGSQIVRVNDVQNPYFDDLKYKTVFTLGRIEIETQRPGVDKEPLKYDITPQQGQGATRLIGIQPAERLQLRPKKHMPDYSGPVYSGTAASKADRPFEFDDVIVGVTNPEYPNDPSKMELPDDPRNPGGHMKDFFEFQRRLTALADKDVTIRVKRGPEGAKQIVDIKVPPMYHRTLGARMKMGQIVAVREKSAAANPNAGVLTPRKAESGDNLEGDVIEKVEVVEPDGSTTTFETGKNLDPVRLPYQLKQWADRLWTARSNNPSPQEREVKLYLKRQSVQNAGPVFMPDLVEVKLPWDNDWRFDRILPMSATSPEAISELGLAYLVKNQVDGPEPTAKSTELLKDDEIVAVNWIVRKPDGTIKEGGWETKAIKGTEWAKLFFMMQTPEIAKVKLKVKRAGAEQEIELEPLTDTTWPMDERGLVFDQDIRIEKADTVLGAIEMGFRDTHRQIMSVYMTLRGLVVGTIPLDSIGGPLTIGKMAYVVAQQDFWQFVFFLAFISIQLAVLNFLPLPVLDGGHMVFLLYESLRGKPASENVRVGATYAGLLLLGCLMIFVLFLDIRRLVGG
jgi:regulator of sigma E protease